MNTSGDDDGRAAWAQALAPTNEAAARVSAAQRTADETRDKRASFRVQPALIRRNNLYDYDVVTLVHLTSRHTLVQ